MRKFPKSYEMYLVSDKVKTIYENFEQYENAEYLSDVLGFTVHGVTLYERVAFNLATAKNTNKLNVVIASLPSFCGSCYMIIDLEDRVKAAEVGLNIMIV